MKSCVLLLLLVVTLLLSPSCVVSMVLSPSGGYSRIAVKISDDAPAAKCAKLLSNLKMLLSGASRAVGDAVGWEVWPAQFIIIVPSHWSEDTCRTEFLSPSGVTRYTGHDMLVVPGLLHAGSAPYTVQTGGCGDPGLVTNIPAAFLLNTTQDMETKYKQLAHEFFKLRFGIFDERGYAGDPVYPDHFIDGNKIRLTAVSDDPGNISGHWTHPGNGSVCDQRVEGCVFSLDSDTQLRCSLGSWPHVSSVTTYCDHDHDLAPTKHSAMCQGVSTKSVILNSPDLQFSRGQHINKPVREQFVPEIVTVQERSERIVLLVETSASMLDNDDWRWVSKSIQKLLRYDLGDETEVGLVTFSHVGQMVSNVTRLLGDIRHHLADLMPDHYRLERNTGSSCLVCGVNTALEILGEDKQAGHIIIVGRGARLADSEYKKIMEHAEYYQVKMSSVLVTKSEAPHVNVYSDLSHATDGQLRLVTPASTNIVKYKQISEALASIVSTQKIVIHERRVDRTETVTYGDMVIDKTASNNVVFGIYVSDTEDHFIKSVTFTDRVTGTVHGPYRGVSSIMDNVNMKTVSCGVGQQCVLTDGQWRYQVEWATGHGRQESVIMVTGDQDTENYNVHVWTSARGPETVVTSLHPVSVHVSVTRGHQPVLRAAVTAVITAPAALDNSLQLLDNGNGDADLVKDDGVYSRTMTHYPGPGVYTISVTVTDNDNQAVIAAVTDYPVTAGHQCCGSTTNINVATATRTGSFQRHVASVATLNIMEVPGSGRDNMPPSRVGDLRLASIDSSSVTIVFTSPGDDYDHGIVSEFIVVHDKHKDQIIQSWSEEQILTRFTVSNVTAGDLVEKILTTTSFPDFFLGIVGVDEAGNYGVISNIIHIVKTNTIYYTQSNYAVVSSDTPAAAVTVYKDDDNEWSLILALCSTFLLLALCLFGGVMYFLRCSTPHKRSLVDVGVSDDVTEPDTVSHCSSEIRHMCQLDVTDLMMADQELRPCYDHELRRTPLVSPVSCLLRHATLTPITEEYLGHFTEFGDSDYSDIADTTAASMAARASSHQRNVNMAVMAVMDSCTDLTSNASEVVATDHEEPEKFSLGVQTVAPSCVANIRQSRDLVQQPIYASLV